MNGSRCYQIDVLKLIFCFTVIISNTRGFMNENTATWFIPVELGWISVHFFFIISGFLMVRTYMGSEKNTYPGKSAADFVIKKFRGIALPYWVALLLSFLIYIYIY